MAAVVFLVKEGKEGATSLDREPQDGGDSRA